MNHDEETSAVGSHDAELAQVGPRNQASPQAHSDVRVTQMPKSATSWTVWAAFGVSALSLVVAVFGLLFQSRTAALGAMPAIALYTRWERPTQETQTEPAVSTLMWKVENTGLGPVVISISEIYIPRSRMHYRMADKAAWPALQAELSLHYNNAFEIAGFDYDPVPQG